MSSLLDDIAEGPLRVRLEAAAVAAEAAWLEYCYCWLEVELLLHDGLNPEKWEKAAARAAKEKYGKAARLLDDVLSEFPATSYETAASILGQYDMRLKRGRGHTRGRVAAVPLMIYFADIRKWATTFPESR